GPIPQLAGSSTGTLIGANSGSTLFVTGAVSGTDLTKVGAGAVTLLAPNNYAGATTVLGGTLTLSNTNAPAVGATTGRAPAAHTPFTAAISPLTLHGPLAPSPTARDQGGTLPLDTPAVNIPGRLTNGTHPALTFNSGTLNFLANNSIGTASSESVG